MWGLLLPLAVGQTVVTVPRVGNVPLEDAIRTCLDGAPSGALPAATEEDPIFPQVVRPLLDLNLRDREAWFGRHRVVDGWPKAPVDVDYAPDDLPMAPPHVATSCRAASRVIAEEIARVSVACRRGTDSCDEALPSVPRGQRRAAARAAIRDERDETWRRSGSDPWAVHLMPFVPHASDLVPMMLQGCGWPEKMAREGRFVVESEVLAARESCLHELALLVHTPDPLRLPCKTGWERVAYSEWDSVRPRGLTDLGLGKALYDSAQGMGPAGSPWVPNDAVRSIERQLSRMDPSPGVCQDADWSAHYKRELVDLWRAAQQEKACDDRRLAPADRVHLCPGLVTLAKTRCSSGDKDGCLTAGDLYREALGLPRDRAEAARLYGSACLMGLDEGCIRKLAVVDEMKASFDQLLTDGHLSAAAQAIEDNALFMSGDWMKKNLPVVFDAALKAGRSDVAAELLDEADASLVLADWLPGAKKRLAAQKPK